MRPDDLDYKMLEASKINALTRALGHDFSDPSLLKTALTHSSYFHENPTLATESNERLEFLGDAVLQLMITSELYRRYPNLAEGQLSKLRSFAVNSETLGQIARILNLQEFLLVGKGERSSIDTRDSLLADSIEALLGALYLDGGAVVAQTAWQMWTEKLGVDLLDQKHLEEFDAKSRLQEYCMKTWQELPIYNYQENKSDKRPLFRVSLSIHNRPLLSTEAASKRKAEMWLARACLQTKLHLTLPIQPNQGAH